MAPEYSRATRLLHFNFVYDPHGIGHALSKFGRRPSALQGLLLPGVG